MLDEKYDAFQEAHVASQDIQDAAVRMEEVVYKEAPKKDKKNKKSNGFKGTAKTWMLYRHSMKS